MSTTWTSFQKRKQKQESFWEIGAPNQEVLILKKLKTKIKKSLAELMFVLKSTFGLEKSLISAKIFYFSIFNCIYTRQIQDSLQILGWGIGEIPHLFL